MLELAMGLEVLVMIGAPLALWRYVRRRWPVSWSTLGAGALTFLGSQLGHVPFNALVGPWLPGSHDPLYLPVWSLFVGLSSGLFEEGARWLVLRFVRTGDRAGPHALAFGVGHGGFESILFGVFVALSLINLLFVERVGVAALGLDAASTALAESQLAGIASASPAGPLLGAFERLCTLPFHVGATCLVMRSVAQAKPRFLFLAVALHAANNAGAFALATTHHELLAEGWLLVLAPASAAAIITSLRALPDLTRPPLEPRPDASGAPIELVRVEKSFASGDARVQALADVTFTLREGERCCLLGPNGAGKTTAIRLITGALAPTRGFAFVYGGTTLDATFLAHKRRMGVVPQLPGMYEEMTVRAYLAFVADVYDAPDRGVEVATTLGLEDVLDRTTTALSGGMQRRLALAAALLPQPDLLVLDEPSAGLDPVAGKQMIEAVRAASAGRTTLLCTHNLAEAEELCDSVVILRAGRVVVHAEIAELKRRMHARVVLRVVGDAAALIDALRALGHAPEAREGAVEIVLAEAQAHTPGLLRALLAQGLDVYECHIAYPTLEELFFRVVEDGAIGGTS